MTPLAGVVDHVIDRRYLAASAAVVRYVRGHAARILHAAGIDSVRSRPSTADEIIASLRVAPAARIAAFWLISELSRDGRLERLDDGRYVVSGSPPLDDAVAVAAAALEPHTAVIGSSRALIDFVAEQYPAFLAGLRSAPSILFKGAGLPMWEAYFSRTNGLYDVQNQLAAAGLRHVWPEIDGPPRILELGAGTGGTTAALLDTVAQLPSGDRATITISDVAPSLLVRASERLASHGPPFRRARLDFERPFDEQGIKPGSVDAIVATNALHGSRDLAATLAHCRCALAPTGALVISESVCGAAAQVHQDFIFNLLPRATAAAPDDEIQGSRFLTAARWEDLLESHRFVGSVGVNSAGPELALLAVVRPLS